MQVGDFYPHFPTRPQHCCSKCGGFLALRYSSGLQLVSELLLAQKHNPVELMCPFLIESKNVILLKHGKRAKVEKYPSQARTPNPPRYLLHPHHNAYPHR